MKNPENQQLQQLKSLSPEKSKGGWEKGIVSGGLIVVDKPAGMSSHDVVGRMRSILKVRRIGHAGTLDPFATGVLLLCIGRATRLVPWLTDAPKTYVAELCFGWTSPTDDTEGEAIKTEGDLPTLEAIQAVLPDFTGRIQQRPPQFSAIRVDGKRAYKSARKGKEIDIPAREVRVDELKILSAVYNEDQRVVSLSLQVRCGAGTYIRSLGRDIGALLGCGAYLTALRRTSVGDYNTQRSFAIHKEKGIDTFESVLVHLHPTQAVQIGLPVLVLDDVEALRYIQGQRIAGRQEQETDQMALQNAAGELLGVGKIQDAILHPLVVLA